MANRNIIATPLLNIFYADGSMAGANMNELEIYDFLIQVAQERLEGCYFIDDEGNKSYIDNLGNMEWPKRFNTMDPCYKLTSLQLEIKIADEAKHK